MVIFFSFEILDATRIHGLNSRDFLTSPNCNPAEPACVDVLTSAYYTLIASTLSTWSTSHTITPDEFIALVQSVLDSLPSSSSIPASRSSSANALIIGEILIDMIWSVDAGLEEVIAESKAALSTCGEQSGKSSSSAKGSIAFYEI